MTESTVYWVVMMDNISMAIYLLFGMSLLAALITAVVAGSLADSGDDKDTFTMIKAFGVCCAFSLVCLVGVALVPDTKQAAAIYVLPRVVNNEQLQQLPNKLLELSNEWLDELKPRKEESN